jgi:hypothetical protein
LSRKLIKIVSFDVLFTKKQSYDILCVIRENLFKSNKSATVAKQKFKVSFTKIKLITQKNMSDPNNNGFYQINNLPESKNQSFNFAKSRRKRGGFLAMAILGVYIIAGGVIGWIALNQGQEGRQAQASVDQNAILVSSIRLLEDKNYNIGDRVDIFLTIQNPNLVTAVSGLKLQMQSAGDSVVWESAHSGALLAPDLPQFSNNSSLDTGIAPTGDVFTLSDMAPSERVEYLVRGRFVKETSDYLAISAKLNFTNPDGEQSITTNRVFTSLNSKEVKNTKENSYVLKASTENIQTAQKFTLKVTRTGEITTDSPTSGTLQVSSIRTGELILDKTCSFTQDNVCEVIVDQGIPQGGLFSAIFKDTSGTSSNILNLSVKGQSSFTVSKLASISTPLGTNSVNGVLPIYIKDVIDANSKLSGDETCVASILDKDSKLVSKLESKVNLTNKQCYFLLSDIDQAVDNSSFYFTLEGTNITQSVNLSKKPNNLIDITSPNSLSNLRTGSSVDLNVNLKPETTAKNSTEQNFRIASDIIGGQTGKFSQAQATTTTTPTTTTTTTTPTSNVVVQNNVVTPQVIENSAKLSVWYVDTGEVKDYYEINNQKLIAKNGVLDFKIPEDFLNKEGLYKVKLTFDNNQETDWLNITFGASGVGFVTSYSSAINPDSLVAGNNMDFVVNGLLDKKGNVLSQTDQCNAGVWTGTGDITEPILAQGAVSGNQCVTSIASQAITKSGPVTLAYTGKSNSLELPQAVQFTVKPNVAAEYGDIYLSYSPALVGYSNSILIGPVADKYGNLADKANLVLDAKIGDTQILNQDVMIRNGYAQTLLSSSSIATAGDLSITLKDKNNNKLILSKSFKVLPASENQKVILPNFPSVINGDEDLKVGLTGLESITLNTGDKCILNVIKSSKQKLKVENNYDKNSGSCSFKQPLGSLRDDSHLILGLQVGQFSFADVAQIQSGKAANFFKIFPVTVLDPKEGVIAQLVSTPILDKMGAPVNDYLQVTLNGKDQKVPIVDGLAKISLGASDFSDKDIKTNLVGQKYLDIVIDAKASNNSIAATNSIQVFLGDQSLSNTNWNVTPSKAASYAQADKSNFLEYKGNTCEVLISSLTEPTQPVPSFYSQNSCLVEINRPAGEYELLFVKRGLVVYRQNLSVQSAYQNVDVLNDTQGYKIKVTAPSLSDLRAQINDNGRIYNYTPDKVTGIINVTQPGLDANKAYLLETDYTDHTGVIQKWYKEVSGAKLVENNN